MTSQAHRDLNYNFFLCRSRDPTNNDKHKAEPGRSSDYESSRGSYTLSRASRSSYSSSYSSSSSSHHTHSEKDDTFKWKGISFDILLSIITACQRRCGKVMFSVVSVCLAHVMPLVSHRSHPLYMFIRVHLRTPPIPNPPLAFRGHVQT